jgi:preprotein translocase subunit SecG
MYNLIIVLIIMICVLLIMVVLVQNSKGGGLAANFGASNQFMGVRRTADFLEKATWTLASALLALSILASWVIHKPEEAQKPMVEQQGANPVPNQGGIPSIPAGPADENPDN